jgi:O-antigen ligase
MIFGAYLLLIALTFLHPIEAFAPDLAVYRPVLVLSLIVLVFAAIDAFRTGEMAARPLQLILLGCFMATIAASMLNTGWAGGALTALVEFSAPALLFVLTVLIVTTMRRLKTTCNLLVLCLVLLSIAGIAAYHYGFMVQDLVVQEHTDLEDHLAVTTPDVIPAEDTSGEVLWRIHSWGFLSDPNDFSQAIVMVLPMLFAVWRRGRPLRNLVRIWLPCAVLLYAAYLTHSRGAVLGLGAILLFGMMRKLGPIRAAVLLSVFALGAVVVGFTGGRGYSSGEESAGGRIAAWSEGLQMLRGNPVLGVGYGNFTEHFAYTAHNSFVLCFAELGLIGYFFWLGMLVLAFKETTVAATTAPAGSDERRWAFLLRLSLLGFLTCALFLSRTYQPTLYVLLALCVAAWHCGQKAAAREPGSAPATVQAPAWAGTTLRVLFASIAIIYVIVRFQNAFVA